MTTIVKLENEEIKQIPEKCRFYVIGKEEDEQIAIKKYAEHYGIVPERAFRYRNWLYIEADEK